MRLAIRPLSIIKIIATTFLVYLAYFSSGYAQTDVGDQIINGTAVYTEVFQDRGYARFSNSCGSQIITQSELQAGAIPDQIIPCPRLGGGGRNIAIFPADVSEKRICPGRDTYCHSKYAYCGQDNQCHFPPNFNYCSSVQFVAMSTEDRVMELKSRLESCKEFPEYYNGLVDSMNSSERDAQVEFRKGQEEYAKGEYEAAVNSFSDADVSYMFGLDISNHRIAKSNTDLAYCRLLIANFRSGLIKEVGDTSVCDGNPQSKNELAALLGRDRTNEGTSGGTADFSRSESRTPSDQKPTAEDFSDFGNVVGKGDNDASEADFGASPPDGPRACAAIGCPTDADGLRADVKNGLEVAVPSDPMIDDFARDAAEKTSPPLDGEKKASASAHDADGWPTEDGKGMKVMAADDKELPSFRDACNSSPSTQISSWNLTNSITLASKPGFVCALRPIEDSELEKIQAPVTAIDGAVEMEPK